MPNVNKVKEDIKSEINKIPTTTDQNMLAALSYLWVISIIMLVVKRGDEYVQFHAKQGLVLSLLTLLAFIPLLGWIVWALAIAGMVVGFAQAWQGKRYQLPLVYGWSQKINF